MEIAVGYVRLVADMAEAEKAIKEMEKNFSKSTKGMQDNLDKTEKAYQDMAKTVSKSNDQMQKSTANLSKGFGSLIGAVGSFSNSFVAILKVAGMMFKAFTAIITSSVKVIINTFKGVISAINGILAALVLLGSAGGKALTAVINSFKGLIDITTTYLKVIKDVALSFITLGKVGMRALTGLSSFLDDLTKKFVFVQLDIRYIIDQMKRFATLFGGAIVGATAASMSFEEAFVKIRRVVNATESEFRTLNQRIRDMASLTPSSAKELAEIGFVAGQMGIEGVDNIESFINVIDKLTQVTNIAGLEGAAAFSKLMVVMDEPMDKIENFASAIVDLGRNFAVFEDEILVMSQVVAGSGAAIGMTTDQILALSAAMSAAGVRAARGGSAMSKIIIELAKAAKVGGKRLEKFAELADMNVKQFKELIDTTPEKAVQEFIEGLGRLVDEGGNWVTALEDVGLSQIRVRDVILRLVNASNLLNKTLNVSESAYKNATALSQEFSVRVSTVWAQINMLKSELLEFVRVIGTPFLEVVRRAVGLLRVFGAVLKNIDPEKIKIITGFLALGAAVFGLVTAVLMGVKALFTLATGLTLLARLVTFILPVIGIMTLLSDIFGDFTIDNLIKQFVSMKEKTVTVYNVLKQMYQDIRDWFKSSDLIKDWAKTLSEAFSGVSEAWDKLINNKDYGTFEFGLDVADIAADVGSDLIQSLESAVKELNDYFKSTDISVFNDDVMSEQVRDNKWIKIAANIANIIKSGFKIAFIELPKLMYQVLESAGLIDEAKRVGDLWWEGFKEAVLSRLPGLFDSATKGILGFSGLIKGLKIPDDWTKEMTNQFEKRLAEKNIDPLWVNIISSGAQMGSAMVNVIATAFKRLPEAIQKAIDWEQIWKRSSLALSKEVDKMNVLLEESLAKLRNLDVSNVESISDNPLVQSLIESASLIFQIYVDLLIKALQFALNQVKWFELGQDIGKSLVRGMKHVFTGFFSKDNKGNYFQIPERTQEGTELENAAKFFKPLSDAFQKVLEFERNQSKTNQTDETKNVSSIEQLVRDIANKIGVNEDLAAAIADIETDFRDLNVKTGKEFSVGPMQVNLEGGAVETINDYFKDYTADMSTLEGKTEAGVRYIQWILETQGTLLQRMVDKYKDIDTIYQAAAVAYRGLGLSGRNNEIDLGRVESIKGYGLSSGAIIPGFGGGDQIPALLERGEAVVPARVVAGGIAAIERWFFKNGVKYQTGSPLVGGHNVVGSNPSAGYNTVINNQLIKPELIDSIAENLDFSREYLEQFAMDSDTWITTLVSVMDKMSIKTVSGMESVGNMLINMLEPMLGEDRTALFRNKFDKFMEYMDNLRSFSEDFLPKQLQDILKPGGGGDGSGDKPEQKQLSLLEHIRNKFDKFTEVFDSVVALWQNLTYIIGKDAERTYQLLLGLSQLFSVLKGDSDIVNNAIDAFSNIRSSVSELTGSNFLGNLAGAAVGGYTYGQNGNIVGAITGAAAGFGLINPLWAVGANIIGGLVPHEEVSPEYKELRAQADALNKQLRAWDQSYRVTKPTKENDANWFEKLFGGTEWDYKGMEASRKTAEKAKEILNRLESLLAALKNNLASAFNASTYEEFVDNFGQSLYNSARAALIKAFMETSYIKTKMKDLTKVMDAAVKTDSEGNVYLDPAKRSAIEKIFTQIKTYSEPFFDMLSELEIAGYGAADAITSMKESLTNVPEVFKISLERFRNAMSEQMEVVANDAAAVYSTQASSQYPVHQNSMESVPQPMSALGAIASSLIRAPTELFGIGLGRSRYSPYIDNYRSGGDIHINFYGPVYGMNDFRDHVAVAVDQIAVDNNLAYRGIV